MDFFWNRYHFDQLLLKYFGFHRIQWDFSLNLITFLGFYWILV